MVIDLGLPLDADIDGPHPLPPISGLEHPDPQLVGIVLSHTHPDHTGLISQIHGGSRIYGPASAEAISKAASTFTSDREQRSSWRAMSDGHALTLGPFTVTPLLVDHSAFESYALLVEAGGRRLLYSGDLRGHGRKAHLWRRLLERPPQPVHALLLEGTRLSRAPGHNTSEVDVEQGLADLCTATSGMVLVFYSGQNIDRLVSVYRAARRTGRKLVLDLYGAAIAEATGNATIPHAHWNGVRVLVPNAQRRRVIEKQAFDRIDRVRANRIFPEQLAGRAADLVLTMRGSMTREIERANCLRGASAVWSMWPGYLQGPDGSPVLDWLQRNDIALHTLHASGHASVADLRALASAIAPDRVVPIHTAAPERYPDVFSRIEPHADGEWWTV